MTPEGDLVSDAKELRLAVTMTGGVSLAIWMGGVATELMHLASAFSEPGDGEDSEPGQKEDPGDAAGSDSPSASGLRPRSTYHDWLTEPAEGRHAYGSIRLDVLSGTSAGGLNAALLGSAMAWGIKPEDFADRLRSTWLGVGSLQNLLRSPFGTDQPSLLKGDEYFKPQVEDILSAWESPTAPNPVQMIITCTLITPVDVQYIDESGRRIIEVDHRGWFEFKGDHFTTEGISKPIALAARTSASYPVAFEPSWLPVDEAELGLASHTELDSPRFAFDGGILANKPLNRAISAIFEQSADRPVDRKLIYVVPVRGAKPTDEKPDEDTPPSIAQMLGHTVSIPLSQSLRDDLEDLRRHEERMIVQRSNRKRWLVQLDEEIREAITTQIWSQFKSQRSLSSVTGTLSRAWREAREQGPRTKIVNAVSDGRKAVDWHCSSYQETYEEPLWPWGLSALSYMAQVLLDIVREAAGNVFVAESTLETLDVESEGERNSALLEVQSAGEGLPELRTKLHTVLERVRMVGRLDAAFWSAVLKAAPETPDERQEWQDWSERCYGNWPAAPDRWKRPLRGVPEEATQAVRDISDQVGEELGRSVATQQQMRRFLSTLGAMLTDVGNTLVERVESHGESLGLGADSIRLVEEMGRGSPLKLLTQLWVIQVATQPGGITIEQPVDLNLIHSDRAVLLDKQARREATQKLAGLQLARFGGFYKRSWRANDYMWGRLDAVQRIGDMLGRDDEEIKALQRAVVAEEADSLSKAIGHSEADGALVSSDARTLKETIDNSDDLVTDAADILEANTLGAERLTNEVATDAFVSTSTQALAVGTSALKGEQSGFGPLRALFGTLKNAVGLPSYLLGQAIISSSRLAGFLLALALTYVVAVLAVELLVEGAEVPELVVAVAIGLGISFYLWVAIFDGLASFTIGAAALSAVAIPVISRELPDETGWLAVGVGVIAVIANALAFWGARRGDRQLQSRFMWAALPVSLAWLVHSFALAISETTGTPWLVLSFALAVAGILLGFMNLTNKARRMKQAGRAELEVNREVHRARFAARIVAMWVVFGSLAAFDLARIVARVVSDTNPVIEFIVGQRGWLALVALALPVVVSLLIRPGQNRFSRRMDLAGAEPQEPVLEPGSGGEDDGQPEPAALEEE